MKWSFNDPFVLFTGNAKDPAKLKMAKSAFHFRPESCVGVCSLPESTVDLSKEFPGLPELTIQEAVSKGAKSFVIGLVNNGGFIEAAWIPSIEEAMRAGLDSISGMHDKVDDCVTGNGQRLDEVAKESSVRIYNLRHYPEAISVGNGERRSGKRVLMVGTDCGSGKMFTSLSLTQYLNQKKVSATFKATGQCGILVSGNGIAIDAVGADFISGAVEALSPVTEGIDIIEGQGSVFHPAYAGVSLGLLHGAQPDYLVLCHVAGRKKLSHFNQDLPSLEACITRNLELARDTNPDCQLLGISVNTQHLESDAAARAYCEDLSKRYQCPSTDPYRFGPDSLEDMAAVLMKSTHNVS